MATMELTDELRGAVAALLGVPAEEVEAVRPVAYTVQVAHKQPSEDGSTVSTSRRWHHLELS